MAVEPGEEQPVQQAVPAGGHPGGLASALEPAPLPTQEGPPEGHFLLRQPGDLSRAEAADIVPWQGTPYSPETIAALPSPAEILGDMGGLQAWRAAPLSSPGDLTFREIADTMDWVDAENPILVSDLLKHTWALMAMPEMVAHVRSQVGIDNGEALAMMEALVPDLPEWAAENVESALADSPLVADFFQQTRNMWKADERLFMMTVLAPLPAKDGFGFRRRDAVVSLAMQYIRDGDHDLSKVDERARFLQMFYQWARQQQQEYLANKGGAAAFGETIAMPFRAAARGVDQLIFGNIVDPGDWKWRQALSIGQNTAVSMGLEPGDGWGWTLTSGAIDALANLSFIDPINLAAGVGQGLKLAKIIPAIGKMARWGRLRRAAISGVPIIGRTVTRLPRFSRSLTARLMWGLFSKTEDQFLELAKKNGVFHHMYTVLKNQGVDRFLEYYPGLRPVADSFVARVLAKCPDEDWLAEAYSLAARGHFTTGKEGEGVEFLNRLSEVTGNTYHLRVGEGLSAGVVSPDHLSVVEGFRPGALAVGNIYVETLADGTTQLRARRFGDIRVDANGAPLLDADGNLVFASRIDDAGDLTGQMLFDVKKADGTFFTAEDNIALGSAPHFGPPRPTSYDNSEVIVLPANWKATAVLGEGVAKGVAPGAAERGMAGLFKWLTTHPDYHAVPAGTTVLRNASQLYVPDATGRGFEAIAEAVQHLLPEGTSPQDAEAVYAAWLHAQGLNYTQIGEHFGFSRGVATRRVARGHEVITSGGIGPYAEVVTGARLTDLNEVVTRDGSKFYHYRTQGGLDVWAKADQGVERMAATYDDMSPVTRLHMLLRDLQAGTVESAEAVTGMGDVVVRNRNILAHVLADPEVRAVLLRYAETVAPDLDEVRLVTRMLPGAEDTMDIRILTNRGAGRVQRAKFITTERAPGDLYAGELEEMRRWHDLYSRIYAGGSRTIWVKDFPTHVPQLRAKKLWRAHASNDGKGWWAMQRRLISAKIFNPRYKPMIDLWNAGDGSRSLGIFLRKVGCRRSFINSWVDRFIVANPADRYAIVRECVEAASEEIGHPLFRFGLAEYVQAQGIRSFATIGADNNPAGWRELGLAYGRSKAEKVVAVPFVPSHMSQYAALPSEEFFTSLRRWKRTQRWGWMPGYRRALVGTGATKRSRVRLAERYRNVLKKAGVDAATLGRLGSDNVLALAYATVGRNAGDPSGMGKVAHKARVLNKAYNVFHGLFTISQLALRFPAWAGRVLLEEQFRAAFFDLPSMARNPFRMMSTYWDTYIVERVAAFTKKNEVLMVKALKDMWDGLPSSPTVDQMLDAARRVIPNIDAYVDVPSLTTPAKVKAAVGAAVSQAFVADANVDIMRGSRYLTRNVVRRTEQLRKGRLRLENMGFDPDFDWGNVEEIRNKGFAMRFVEDVTAAGSIPVQWAKGNMTPDQGERYGVSLGRGLHQMVNDPIIRGFGLNRLLAGLVGHGDEGGYDAVALVRSAGWDDLRTNVRRMAEYAVAEQGASATILTHETAVAEWFLKNVVDVYADYLFGWLWRNAEPDEAVRIIGSLARREATEVTVGSKTYMLLPGQHHMQSFTNTIRDMVLEQSSVPGVMFPPTITSHWAPRYLFEENTDTITGMMKHMTHTIMAFAGDKASQWLNRRPAYMSAYRDGFRYYTARGFSREAAQRAAHFDAVQQVNYVFYNMDNAVPFLRAMNRISPFFTAWWEVAQTWAYKIPAVYGWPVGIAVMNRKVNRVVNALVDMGLLTVDAEPDPDSPIGTRQLRLRISSDPNTGNPFGNVMSKTLYHMLVSPANIAMHIVNLGNLFSDDKGEHDENFFRDTIELSVGLPTDIWSHGLMAVNQYYLGLNPIGSNIAAQTLSRIPYAVDLQRDKSLEGETVAAMATRLGVSVSELYAINRQAFTDQFTPDMAKKMFEGDIGPDTVVLPTGFELKVPHSSFVEAFIDPVFFPYGRDEAATGAILDFWPAWSQYCLRGFGIWGGTPSGDQDYSNSGFFTAMLPQETRAGMTADVLLAMQHLEAEEGLMTKVVEAGNRVSELLNLYGEALGAEEVGDTYTISNYNAPGAELFQAAVRDRQELESELLTRATHIAGGSNIARGIMGFLAPAIPRMLYHEQEIASVFHRAREAAEAIGAGEEFDWETYVMPALSGDDEVAAKDAALFRDMVGAWLADPSRGSFAKDYLLKNFPELLPFTLGKTYWAGSGEPPEVLALDRYSDDLRTGMRKPYTPDVFMIRYAMAGNAFSRETGIVERYGNDPVVAASRQAYDYAGYREYMDQFNVMNDSLYWQDDLFNQGAYLDWKERNREDNATLISELQNQLYKDIDVLEQWSVNADEYLNMSPTERREFVGNMRAIISSLRQGMEEWREEFDTTEIDNPRQKALNEYFDTYVGGYYDTLAGLYEQVDAATDSEQRSRLYDEIRNFQNMKGVEEIRIQGVKFPSVLEWWWGAKTEEEKEDQLLKWVGTKPEWLNIFAAQRLCDKVPEAEAYLPTTVQEASIYNAFNAAKNTIGDMFEPGMEDYLMATFGTISEQKISGALEDALNIRLREQGRAAEAEWRDMVPLQRLHTLGLLPLTLQPYVPQVNMIVETLRAQDPPLGPESGLGDRLFGLVYTKMLQDIETNPQIGTDLIGIGQRMFDSADYDSIFARLFQGAYIGEI